MKIFIEYTGVISSCSGNKQEWAEIDNDTNIEDLLYKLGYKKEYHRFIAIRMDGEEAYLDTPLKDNCAITLFLPAGGG
jgi:hypothetical protein